MMVPRMRAFTVVAAVAGLALAGCAQTTEGRSNPATDPGGSEPGPTTETTSAPPVTTPAPAPGSPDYLTSESLCELLTPEELAGLGLRPTGEPDVGPFGEECRWGSGGNGTLNLSYGADFGVDDLNERSDASYEPVTVGSLSGVRVRSSDGVLCELRLGITDSSFIAIGGGGGIEVNERACELADGAAPLVEARLP